MIHVIATLRARPGARDALLAEFARLVPLVRAEVGCLAYVPAIDAETGIATQRATGPDCVTVVEQWTSLAALDAHDRAPHMLAFRERVRDLVVDRDIRMLAPA